jgi:hypothetical protein
VEDLWFASAFQRQFQRLQTELYDKAVGELPTENILGDKINDPHQAEEAIIQRNVGDICGPQLIHCREHAEIHQSQKALRWIPRNRGAGLMVD